MRTSRRRASPRARDLHRDQAPTGGPWNEHPLPHASGSKPLGASALVVTYRDGENLDPLIRLLASETTIGEVIVLASDPDRTTVDAVARAAAAHPGLVRLLSEPGRSGKMAAINHGFAIAGGDVIVVASGDVLPEPGAVDLLVQAAREPGVGMSGGRPVPDQDDDTFARHAAHMIWSIHHRLASVAPKLGEVVAIRAPAAIPQPATAVDEAALQASCEAIGFALRYVPQAVIRNRGPATARLLVAQRRRIHSGHASLRRDGYTVAGLRPGLVGRAVIGELAARWRDPRRLVWGVGAVALEAWARLLARSDLVRGKEHHVWQMVSGSPTGTTGPHGGVAGDGTSVAQVGSSPPAPD